MSEISALAPAIVAVVVSLVGAAWAYSIGRNPPVLVRPSDSEEEPGLPFDKRTPTNRTPEERLVRKIFTEPKKRRKHRERASG